MDSIDLSLFTQDFAYENGLDFSNLISPSMFTPFQEPNSSNCVDIENDATQPNCETTMTRKNDEPMNKRFKRTEIEKKRRQEARSLLKILRDLLPSQYLSGTRSSSDHVHESVNYITDLQKKIKEVREKKDRIKRSVVTHPSSKEECSIRSLASSIPSNCSCVGDTHIAVVVKSCLIGLEIVVSCCVRHKSCLSSVLQLLAQEQCLNVVSCISTGLQQRFMHTIVSELEEGIEVYFSELQEKIIKMVS